MKWTLIAANLSNFTPPPHPKGITLEGQLVRLEPLDAKKHAQQLFESNSEDGGVAPSNYQCYNPPMQTIQKTRLRPGQFAPGQSGNPGGRPKDEHRVAELARSYTLEAIDTLVELMRDGKDERMRGTAAQALLDRGWGKGEGRGGYGR